MHMVSRKDLTCAELETVRASNSPATVVTANGEVPTKEEATVNVRELDLFLAVMLLEDTLAVLSLGKLCEDHGYNYRWPSGQKPYLTNSSTSSSPTLPTSSSQETVTHTEHPAATRSESMSEEL